MKNKNNFGRDAGVMISGELLPMATHNLIQYSTGIFQGTGVSTGETNNGKDFAGMLLFQPVRGLRVGGGAYFGQATYLKTGDVSISDHVRDRWYVSADYKSDRFYARTEWVHGNDGGVDKEGLYGLGLFYLIPQKLNILGKVDYYNRNKDINSEVIDYTFGLNYYFYPMCRVQLNYTYSDYSNKWNASNSNTVFAQLQIAF
ncbi:MAG: porin [Dysgonomonas sp.]